MTPVTGNVIITGLPNFENLLFTYSYTTRIFQDIGSTENSWEKTSTAYKQNKVVANVPNENHINLSRPHYLDYQSC